MSVIVTEGNDAILMCTATGDPVPVQSWSQNGNQLTSGGRYQISGNSSVLTVQQVTEVQDEGVFTCHASNEAGSDSATVTLSVQGTRIIPLVWGGGVSGCYTPQVVALVDNQQWYTCTLILLYNNKLLMVLTLIIL